MSDEIGLIDPAGEAYWQDIHGTVAPLRERWPVVRSTAGDFEILRYEHVEPLLRDARLHQALHRMLANQGITSGPLYDWWQLIISALDPPVHTRLRSLIGRGLSPKQVEQVRPRIRALTHELLDDQAASGDDTTDVLDGLCNVLPLTVLCEMLGIAPDDQAVVEQWTVTVGLAFSAYLPPDLLVEIERAIIDFDAFTSELIDRRRADPTDDLFSALVHAEEAGDRLSAGRAAGVADQPLLRRPRHDAQHPRDQPCTCSRRTPTSSPSCARTPSSCPVAVEEMVRYEPIISGIPRIPTVDLEIAGVHDARGLLRHAVGAVGEP